MNELQGMIRVSNARCELTFLLGRFGDQLQLERLVLESCRRQVRYLTHLPSDESTSLASSEHQPFTTAAGVLYAYF
jgi:hypothetical protein